MSKPKVRNPYVEIGGVLYEKEIPEKATCSRKVYDAIKGMYSNPSVWLQCNNVEDLVFQAMAVAAVNAVRSWDRGKTNTSIVPSVGVRNNAPYPKAVLKAVRFRSGGKCEIKSEVCVIEGHNYHHVLPRSLGGPNTVENLKHACVPCHTWIHGGKDK